MTGNTQISTDPSNASMPAAARKPAPRLSTLTTIVATPTATRCTRCASSSLSRTRRIIRPIRYHAAAAGSRASSTLDTGPDAVLSHNHGVLMHTT